MTEKKKKRWLGLEPHEAFTEPVKDPDPHGKIHSSGIKIEDPKKPRFTPVAYKRRLESVKNGDTERLYWGPRKELKKNQKQKQC